jgi:hypothetical protein
MRVSSMTLKTIELKSRSAVSHLLKKCYRVLDAGARDVPPTSDNLNHSLQIQAQFGRQSPRHPWTSYREWPFQGFLKYTTIGN